MDRGASDLGLPLDGGIEMASKQRLNVLVVDRDEATNLELKDFLSEDGYQPFALSDPDQVVEEIKKGRFQLVLLDVSPPEDAGIELLQRIRRADSDICVVAMTAMPTVAAAVRTLKIQAFDYLQKPLEMEELRAVIAAPIREKGLVGDLESRLNQEAGRRLRERRAAGQWGRTPAA